MPTLQLFRQDPSPDPTLALDRVVLEGLSPIASALALIFLVFIVFNLVDLPAQAVVPVVIHDSCLVAIFTGLRILLGRGKIPPRWGNASVAVSAWLVLSNVLLTFHLLSQPFYTVHVLLIVIGAGSFLLSATWLALTLGVIVTAWAVVAWPATSTQQLVHYWFALFASSALSVSIHASRSRSYRRLHRALLAAREEIKEREQAELALAESEARFRSISDQALMGIVIIQGGLLRYANQAYAALTEYTVQEVLRWKETDLRKTVHPEDQEELARQESRRGAADPATVAHLAYRLVTWGGKVKWVDQWSTTISYGGRPAELITIIDIDARKRAEEERARLQQQLDQAKRVESIGRLAGGVAHDFNNLLTPIILGAEMILQQIRTEDPISPDVAVIRDAARRAKEVTAQLLAFGRKQVLRMSVLDLNEHLPRIEGMLRRMIREDISITVNLAPGPARILADAGQVDQVLVNLAVNAQDAMPDGGALEVSVSSVVLEKISPATRPGPHVMLQVRDTGHGMDQKTLELIFEPFFTTKGPGHGSGLGLATVLGIVEQHGGQIGVESTIGRGTTFAIYFPQVEETTQAPHGAEPRPPTRGGGTVLVVEDEPAVRKLVVQTLGRLGYSVLAARDAAEALSLTREHAGEIDVLLTDVVLPGMSGVEVYRAVSQERPRVKVVYMSGYADEVIAKHGVLDPGVTLLQKPFSLHELARALEEALGAPQVRR